ncbi:MAG: hypothetical protein JWM78_1801 [Verrucomicrobiaceae bacterium]|nr:hypothetical protein [Verrucomicrobiaceae bacterium]
MAYANDKNFAALDVAIDLLVQTGNAHALKQALANCELLDSFSDYLINLFNETVRRTNSIKAAHDLIGLVHDFAGNIEQQYAVIALLARNSAND